MIKRSTVGVVVLTQPQAGAVGAARIVPGADGRAALASPLLTTASRLAPMPSDARAAARRPAALTGWAALLAGCLSLAIGTVLTKSLLAKAPALPLVFAQLLVSTVVVWLFAAWRRRLPSTWAQLKLGVPGLLQPGLVYVLTALGLAITPVSVEGFLFAFESLLVALLAWPLLGERLAPATTLSLGLGLVGGLVLAGFTPHGVQIPALGVGLILACVLCAAFDTLATRALVVGADPLTMTAAGHVAGLAVIAVALLASGPYSWHFLNDGRTAAGVAVSGVLMQGVATLLFNFALGRIPAGRAATIFPTISLAIVLGGIAFLGERLALLQIGGGLLIVLAAVVTARGGINGKVAR